MTSSAFRIDLHDDGSAEDSGAHVRERSAIRQVLAATPVGSRATVEALDLENDLVSWLRAVGIAEGEKVTVLRHALFGGPIHVRTGAGGEFALNRGLAKCIHVRVGHDADPSEPRGGGA